MIEIRKSFVASHQLFRFSNPARQIVMSHVIEPLALGPGSTVYKEGDVTACVYLVVSGQLTVSARLQTDLVPPAAGSKTPKGWIEVPIATLGPGSYFGEEEVLPAAWKRATELFIEQENARYQEYLLANVANQGILANQLGGRDAVRKGKVGHLDAVALSGQVASLPRSAQAALVLAKQRAPEDSLVSWSQSLNVTIEAITRLRPGGLSGPSKKSPYGKLISAAEETNQSGSALPQRLLMRAPTEEDLHAIGAYCRISPNYERWQTLADRAAITEAAVLGASAGVAWVTPPPPPAQMSTAAYEALLMSFQSGGNQTRPTATRPSIIVNMTKDMLNSAADSRPASVCSSKDIAQKPDPKEDNDLVLGLPNADPSGFNSLSLPPLSETPELGEGDGRVLRSDTALSTSGPNSASDRSSASTRSRPSSVNTRLRARFGSRVPKSIQTFSFLKHSPIPELATPHVSTPSRGVDRKDRRPSSAALRSVPEQPRQGPFLNPTPRPSSADPAPGEEPSPLPERLELIPEMPALNRRSSLPTSTSDPAELGSVPHELQRRKSLMQQGLQSGPLSPREAPVEWYRRASIETPLSSQWTTDDTKSLKGVDEVVDAEAEVAGEDVDARALGGENKSLGPWRFGSAEAFRRHIFEAAQRDILDSALHATGAISGAGTAAASTASSQSTFYIPGEGPTEWVDKAFTYPCRASKVTVQTSATLYKIPLQEALKTFHGLGRAELQNATVAKILRRFTVLYHMRVELEAARTLDNQLGNTDPWYDGKSLLTPEDLIAKNARLQQTTSERAQRQRTREEQALRDAYYFGKVNKDLPSDVITSKLKQHQRLQPTREAYLGIGNGIGAGVGTWHSGSWSPQEWVARPIPVQDGYVRPLGKGMDLLSIIKSKLPDPSGVQGDLRRDGIPVTTVTVPRSGAEPRRYLLTTKKVISLTDSGSAHSEGCTDPGFQGSKNTSLADDETSHLHSRPVLAQPQSGAILLVREKAQIHQNPYRK